MNIQYKEGHRARERYREMQMNDRATQQQQQQQQFMTFLTNTTRKHLHSFAQLNSEYEYSREKNRTIEP